MKDHIISRFEYVRNMVRMIIHEHPETASDDILLIFKYWERVHNVRIDIPEHVRKTLTRPSTIIRRKHELQENKKDVSTRQSPSLTDY